MNATIPAAVRTVKTPVLPPEEEDRLYQLWQWEAENERRYRWEQTVEEIDRWRPRLVADRS